MNRRGFLGLLAGFIAAPRAKWQDLWRPADLIYVSPFRNFDLVRELAKTKLCQPLDPAAQIGQKIVFNTVTIGQYADYYSEHDGMVETGPGCRERLDARIRALPEDDPRKIWVPEVQV